MRIKFSVIILLTVVVFGIMSVCFEKFFASLSNIPTLPYTIVLDAGHGGRDGGCVGTNGTLEKNLNLEYTYSLKEKLVKAGYKVVLTRKNDDGLYNSFDKNKKTSDMIKRMNIIKENNPSLVISIHMNSFSDKTIKGSMTYHKIDDQASINCANLIQQSINSSFPTHQKTTKKGDFYMLNCSYYTSVLIECGYLSNPEEEMFLNSKEYKEKFTQAIFNGILLYFGSFPI